MGNIGIPNANEWLNPMWDLSQVVQLRLVVPLGSRDELPNAWARWIHAPVKTTNIWADMLLEQHGIRTMINFDSLRTTNSAHDSVKMFARFIEQLQDARVWDPREEVVDEEAWSDYLGDLDPQFRHLALDQQSDVVTLVARRAAVGIA